MTSLVVTGRAARKAMMTGAPESLLAALIAGLVGSTHCLGMCGGIAAAIGMSTAGEGTGAARALAHALVYNLARVASYSAAGAVAGGIGLALGQAVHAPAMVLALRSVTGLVLVAIGLQVAFNLRLLRPLETAGFRIWKRIAPTAGGLARRNDLVGALGLGALWGWLPCGLVYGMLLAAAGSGGPVSGALVMVAFGLGTLPAMVATGTAGARFLRLRRSARFRLAAGLAVVALGFWTLAWPAWMGLSGMPHADH